MLDFVQADKSRLPLEATKKVAGKSPRLQKLNDEIDVEYGMNSNASSLRMCHRLLGSEHFSAGGLKATADPSTSVGMTSAFVTAGVSPPNRQLLIGTHSLMTPVARMRIAQSLRDSGDSWRARKVASCYTSFALSDLDVSGGLPLRIKAIQPGTDFPQAPTYSGPQGTNFVSWGD
jgi:hypothetical protein